MKRIIFNKKVDWEEICNTFFLWVERIIIGIFALSILALNDIVVIVLYVMKNP